MQYKRNVFSVDVWSWWRLKLNNHW